MGIFDSVMVPCPVCGEQIEFQSKAGACRGKIYSCESVPVSIASDINGGKEKCYNCKTTVVLFIADNPERVEMFVSRASEDGNEEDNQYD